MEFISYFGNYKRANEAVKKLKKKGFNSFVDLNEHYVNSKNVNINMPGNKKSTSLSDLVLNSGSNYTDAAKAPLAAADPKVSGMGTTDEIADINYRVITNINANKKDALKIIKDMGGYLDDPNIERKK
ncbi:MAG: hypothetical protein FH751_01700 [Firmicutes bacterium]|nr:hypothetical protein [Bacillota bacterium]